MLNSQFLLLTLLLEVLLLLLFLLSGGRLPEHTVDIVLDGRALAADDKAVVDALLDDDAVFARGVHQQDQILPLAVLRQGVAPAYRAPDRVAHPLAELLKHWARAYGVPLAVHHRAEHQIHRLAAALEHALHHAVDALKDRISAEKSARSVVVSAGELLLDMIEHGVAVHHFLAQPLELLHQLFRRAQPLLVEVVIHRILIELARLVITAHGGESLHRHGLPVGKGINLGGVHAELLHLEEVLPQPQQQRGFLHTVAEHLPIAPRLVRGPDDRSLHGQEFAAVQVAGVEIQRDAFVLILCALRLAVQFLEAGRILDQGDLPRPEKHALTLLDVIHGRQSRLLEFFLRVVDHALKGVMDVAHIAVLKEKLLEPIARHALVPVVDQDLQQIGELRVVGFGASRDQLSVPLNGKAAEHPHIQHVFLHIRHSHAAALTVRGAWPSFHS